MRWVIHMASPGLKARLTYTSRGKTRVFEKTAPMAPAAASASGEDEAI